MIQKNLNQTSTPRSIATANNINMAAESKDNEKTKKTQIYQSNDEESESIRQKLVKEYSYVGYFKTWNSSKTLADREYDILTTVSNILSLKKPNVDVELIDTDIDYQTEHQLSLKDSKRKLTVFTNYQ